MTCFGGAEAFKFTGLQRPQELGLLGERNVSDLVQKKGSAIRELEATDSIGLRIGKRTLNVTEEFALKETLGQGANVDGSQWSIRSRAGRVQHSSD